MSSKGLVLSLFPGLGIWEIAFRELGFCVVRGPEILLGMDIRDFAGIAGKFDGIIAGIPCQAFSRAQRLNGKSVNECGMWGDMTPEFERIRDECEPSWWLTENVAEAPIPAGASWNALLDASHFGANQARVRRFSSNLSLCPVPVARLEQCIPTVTATEYKVAKNGATGADRARASRVFGRRMTLAEINESFGMPADFETPALTIQMSYHMRGNAVPLPLARALAAAIIKETERPKDKGAWEIISTTNNRVRKRLKHSN